MACARSPCWPSWPSTRTCPRCQAVSSGVDVFFVLSGYLITDLLVARFNRDGRLGLREFWIRRARRLLPALAVLLVTVTAATAVLEPDQLDSLRPALRGAVTYTSNWWQAFHHQSYFEAFGPPPRCSTCGHSLSRSSST